MAAASDSRSAVAALWSNSRCVTALHVWKRLSSSFSRSSSSRARAILSAACTAATAALTNNLRGLRRGFPAVQVRQRKMRSTRRQGRTDRTVRVVQGRIAPRSVQVRRVGQSRFRGGTLQVQQLTRVAPPRAPHGASAAEGSRQRSARLVSPVTHTRRAPVKGVPPRSTRGSARMLDAGAAAGGPRASTHHGLRPDRSPWRRDARS